MSDAYAKEFEKWLLESKGSNSHGEETEDEDYREDDGEEEHDSDSVINVDADESEEDLCSGVTIKKKKMNSSTIMNDLAPILVDDDDEDLIPNEKDQFEDEPPVLEPVPKQVQGSKISTDTGPKFSPQKCIRNYSRRSSKNSPPEKEKHLKTYSNKIKQTDIIDHSEESSQNGSSKLKETGSGNIFDKINSMSESYEDAPPPLIPSPDAEELHSESQEADPKHPSHSPDFCAMEADSTSEIPADKAGGISGSRRLSKNSFHGDVSIECDSTCMLGTSPAIVSPASVSNGDADDVRDPGGGGSGGEGEIESVDTKKCEDSGKDKPDERQSALEVAESLQNCVTSEDFSYTDLDKCPKLTCGNKSFSVCASFPVTIKTEDETDNACCYLNEPPILSVISPPAAKPHPKSRKKRHTIDSPETFSRSRKRSCTAASPCTDAEGANFDISSPPTLTHVSETVITFSSRGKRTKIVKPHSKKNCPCCSQDKSLHRKRRRRRCNTLPFADLSEYVDHLPDHLRSFVVSTTELSQLQSCMHRLLYQLFPQLKSDLDTMSPESSRFENLVSDLVTTLEGPEEEEEMEEDKDHAAPPPLILCKDLKSTSALSSLNTNPIVSVLDINALHSDKSSSSLPSPTPSQAADSNAKDNHNQTADAIFSNSSSKSGNDSHEYNKSKQHCLNRQQQSKSVDLKDNDLVIPQLSQLTLQETEDILRPTRVLLHREPETLLIRFAHLSCIALQLLLPDLAVSLSNELAQSPSDLIVFIENVLLTNLKRQSKL